LAPTDAIDPLDPRAEPSAPSLEPEPAAPRDPRAPAPEAAGDDRPPVFLPAAAPAPQGSDAGADAPARAFATDPRHDVVLEASAGTGKTTVLVRRYLALLEAGVDPRNILAITFTRKAAAEMRERIVSALRRAALESEAGRRRWVQLRDRLPDIAIGTIDAFCLALLGEFPLEADLDPGFDVADETEVARILEDALDRTLAAARSEAADRGDVRLLLAAVPARRLRAGLAHLLDRRHVAPGAFVRLLARQPAGLDADAAVAEAAAQVREAFEAVPRGIEAFVADGPSGSAAFALLAADLETLASPAAGSAEIRAALDHLAAYTLTKEGAPRQRPPGARKADFPSSDAWLRHCEAIARIGPVVARARAALHERLDAVLVRGLWRVYTIALALYRRALADHDRLDFAEALERAVSLLQRMDEFARSRYRLESRYHHVLVDEFQDTSRLQWTLVGLLVQAWGEGAGLVHEAPVPPSIFVVGDRKQSIYRFRDADVTLFDEASRFIAALRPGGAPRRSIARSFRSRPEILAFVNDLCGAMAGEPRPDAFRYNEDDRFPLGPADPAPGDAAALGLVVASDPAAAADRAAAEIARLLDEAVVRDPAGGPPRPVRPGDIAILFRARESHRGFERALEARGIPTYVYKGLGFFEADEIQDLSALIRWLAAPASPSRTAALLRSRLVRLSDPALVLLAPDLPGAVAEAALPAAWDRLDPDDRRVLAALREAAPRWLAAVDRVPPAELLDRILDETAYARELGGPRAAQARENVKKMRAVVRRLQNRGYLTMARLARHLDWLAAGDESNAVIDAADAVNLMTVHAAKGLEFPIVFVGDIGRGTGGTSGPVRLRPGTGGSEPSVSIGVFRSEADREEERAEREETKRLLYVALTRARDRLYLTATVRKGRLAAARGSLAEVLPADFRRFLETVAIEGAGGERGEHAAGDGAAGVNASAGRDAAGEATGDSGAGRETGRTAQPESSQQPGYPSAREARWDEARWTIGGVEHRFRVCRPETPPPRVPPTPARPPDILPVYAARAPRSETRWPHIDARALALARAGATAGRPPAGASDVLVGRLVHRLLARGLPADLDLEAIRSLARRLLTGEERVEPDLDARVDEAAGAYLRLRASPDLAQLLEAGEAAYEVPFSWALPDPSPEAIAAAGAASAEEVEGLIVRGTIDCLIWRQDGGLTVVEVKTGRQAAWHDAQLQIYVEAIRAAAPGRAVEGRLIYG
jgi:ATP-dependent helicase/nuclease subunit A